VQFRTVTLVRLMCKTIAVKLSHHPWWTTGKNRRSDSEYSEESVSCFILF